MFTSDACQALADVARKRSRLSFAFAYTALVLVVLLTVFYVILGSLVGLIANTVTGVFALLILRSARADRGDADFWSAVAARRRKAEREDRWSDF